MDVLSATKPVEAVCGETDRSEMPGTISVIEPDPQDACEPPPQDLMLSPHEFLYKAKGYDKIEVVRYPSSRLRRRTPATG